MLTLRRGLSLLVFLLAVLSFAQGQIPLRLRTVTPCRLVDTRPSNGGGGPIQGGTSQPYNLPSLAESGGAYGTCSHFSLAAAQAYSLNVTLVPVNGGPVGYLTIWPTGEAQPFVSLMNSDGRIKANAAIVPAGTNGEVSVYVTNTTNVLIDIDAYFDNATDTSALAFFPLSPCRIVDTRNGEDGGTLQAMQERDYSIPGHCGIPSNATAYSFNVTAIPPANGTLFYLTVWPAGQTQPTVSTLNDQTGTIVANAAIVPAGSEQKTAFWPYNNTDLLVDVDGYFAPAGSGTSPLSLYTLTPCRVLDTRNGIGLFNGTIPVGIVGSACGVPAASPEAFVLNATVVPDGDLLYLTLWPEGLTQPTVSTLNANDGAITSNMAIVPAGTGNDSINAYADLPNYTQLILDISSYFAPISALDVISSSLPDAVLTSDYGYTLVATGGVAPYSWTITSGSLPPGMALSSAGLISGTPTSSGPPYTFTVKVTDSNSPQGNATAQLSLQVDTSPGTLEITSPSSSNGTVNTPYNSLLTANGGYTPYTWSVSSGTLPAGLSLNSSTGLISGTPAAAGLSEFFVTVTDAQGNHSTQQVNITVNSGDANGTLNGMYAGSFAGYMNGESFVAAFSLTADGNGNITGGETDSNDASGVKHNTITSGTYSIAANGLGQINWTSSDGGNVVMLVSTASGEDMRIIAYNQNGTAGTWGAGVLRQQNPSDFALGALAGSWAFGFQGFDSSGKPFSGDGAYQINSSGTISNGVQDNNDFGTHEQTTFTGTVTSSPPIDPSGRLMVQLHYPNGETFNFAQYVISAGERTGIEIDSGGALTTDNSLRQTGGPFNLGSMDGTSVGRGSRQANAGGSSPESQAIVVLIGSSGNGNISFTEDLNSGGTVELNQLETGTYTVASNGRGVFTLASGATIVCYLIATNEGYCINATPASGSNDKGAEVLYFEPQTAPAGGFTDASFSGEYLGGSLPQYVSGTFSQIDTNVASGAATFSSTYSQSGPGGTQLNQTLNGTYNVNSTTGALTISESGNTVYAGFIVSPTKVEYITAAPLSNPLTLIEWTSSAPRHR